MRHTLLIRHKVCILWTADHICRRIPQKFHTKNARRPSQKIHKKKCTAAWDQSKYFRSETAHTAHEFHEQNTHL